MSIIHQNERIHKNNIIQVIFGNICVYMYTYVHMTTMNKKGILNLNESKEGCVEFGGRRGKGEMKLHYNLKNKILKKKTS